MLKCIYDSFSSILAPEFSHFLTTWTDETRETRGELDRKKKANLVEIAQVVDCPERDADLYKFVFAVERYIEYRAINLMERSIGRSVDEFSAPEYVVLAVERARTTEKLISMHSSRLSIEEDAQLEAIFTATRSGPFRDIFQEQFQSLLPRQVRHALGQFYTPQWLARHVLRKTGYRFESHESLAADVCDPTCGSGVFLVAAAEEIRQAVISGSLSVESGSRLIQTKIHGSDIESLPALLACAILSIANAALLYGENSEAPRSVVTTISNEDALNIRSDKDKNVDLIVSNPPWTNWEYMPTEFRDKHVNLWPQLGIFDKKSTTLSFSKEDISALFVAHSVHYRLRTNGRFGFVLPESLVKSTKNHAGFRKFQLGLFHDPYKITAAEDFVSAKPFEGVSNRTITLYGTNDGETSYPIPITKWGRVVGKEQPNSGSGPIIGLSEELQATLSNASDLGSSWSTGSYESNDIHRKIDGENYYRGRTGLFTGGANGVFHLREISSSAGLVSVENVTDRAKRKVESVEADLESTFLYPFLRGRDVSQWNYRSELLVLLPHTPESKMRPVPDAIMKETAPRTYEYLTQFRDVLSERKGFSKWELDFLNDGFYACQRVGDYTFAQWKVVWRYISSRFTTAVVGPSEDLQNKPHIPNEKLMLIGCSSSEEAYYVGGVLASAPVISHVHGRMISTQIPPSIVQNVKIPKFDPENQLHFEISDLCREGHVSASQEREREVRITMDEIDRLSCKLWGLDIDAVRAEREEIGY